MDEHTQRHPLPPPRSILDRVIQFTLRRSFAVFLLALVLLAAGVMTAPFDWDLGVVRSPVPVDAIPDIGENQQVVYTTWSGRTPQDVEDQITYPLSVALLGVPGVKTIRSTSAFGFSNIYVIFNDDVDFYWARSRILEKLSSLPPGNLPPDVTPVLGPDATGLGQIFWYTLEGLDDRGENVGGWDVQELRTYQDFIVKYALMAADGVAEVASVGGFVKEYQVDLDPTQLRAYDVTLEEVINAVKRSNLDVGARTVEINKVEYLVRGLGFIRELEDLEYAVVATRNNSPVFLNQVAHVSLGPSLRLGALDKNGHEAVGGVVTMRYGENPLQVIKNVKRKIDEISLGLPQKTLDDGAVARVSIVPFYDRTELIHETLDTLDTALVNEILVSVLVVLVMLSHLGSALLISSLLPMAVLLTFLAMRLFGVDANIVALAGIAIAIGAMVDMSIILTEAIIARLRDREGEEPPLRSVYEASREVGPAVITAIATTIISFLPVFTLQGAEGKLFQPLAYTKTFALAASLLVSLTLTPPLAHLLFRKRPPSQRLRFLLTEGLLYLGAVLAVFVSLRAGLLLAGVGTFLLLRRKGPVRWQPWLDRLGTALLIGGVLVVLADIWLPLGPTTTLWANGFYILTLFGLVGVFFWVFYAFYSPILRWCLQHKGLFLSLPLFMVLLGGTVWQGFDTLFGWLPAFIHTSAPVRAAASTFPGLSQQFMPDLDEGAFLFMPSTMPHASIGEVLDIIRKQDDAIRALPEVKQVVGKVGRAETALDPAPVSMIETVINYHQEYLTDADGTTPRFRWDPDAVDLVRTVEGAPAPGPDGRPYAVQGSHERDEEGRLIPDPDGRPFRIWRPALDPELNPGRPAWAGVRSADDIWAAIVQAARIPGTTTAPKLQPISARLVMLQSGIRAPLAVEVKGPDLEAIQKASSDIERFLRHVGSIRPDSVVAERIVAKPYLEIHIDRRAAAQYGLDLQTIQDAIETAVGGKTLTTTVEGRERYPVRVRYMRELRGDPASLEDVLVATPDGVQYPLGQVAEIRYTPGPSVIRTEDAFLASYVLFDVAPGATEVDAVQEAEAYLSAMAQSGAFLPPAGVSYSFTGSYENHLRSQQRLRLILPLTLALIFVILYIHFGSVPVAGIVFSGVAVAWAGGFVMIWLYAQPWFLQFSVFGESMQELFQVGQIHLSLPVWVGFLALFGIATDDGVVMATYLRQSFGRRRPRTREEARRAAMEAGRRRVRPCLMTSATTVLALLPVLTSSGRGSDLLAPMAIPTFGGMTLAVLTMLVAPVLYCWLEERRLPDGDDKPAGN